MSFDFGKWTDRVQRLAGAARAKALELWAAMLERGWPTRVPEFFKNPPRWFVVCFFAIAILVVGRAVYLIGFGTADEVNKFLVGVAAFAGAPFLVWRTWIADRQRHVAQEELYTSLLVKAVEQLGATREEKTYETPELEDDLFEEGFSETPPKKELVVRTVPNTEVRLGAIYALEKLAADYLPLHWQIMEILCAYVRKNAGSPRPCSDEIRAIYAKWFDDRMDDEKAALVKKRRDELEAPFYDVQAALAVIGRRSQKQRAFENRKAAESYVMREYRLDFSASHLAGADLRGLHFENADFHGSCLEDARLADAHLKDVWFNSAHLEGAMLAGAHLEGANFYEAHLDGALLFGADLKDANFLKTHLKGAQLTGTERVNQDQLDSAFGDENTKLPAGLTRPAHWTKGGAGQGDGG